MWDLFGAKYGLLPKLYRERKKSYAARSNKEMTICLYCECELSSIASHSPTKQEYPPDEASNPALNLEWPTLPDSDDSSHPKAEHNCSAVGYHFLQV